MSPRRWWRQEPILIMIFIYIYICIYIYILLFIYLFICYIRARRFGDGSVITPLLAAGAEPYWQVHIYIYIDR